MFSSGHEVPHRAKVNVAESHIMITVRYYISIPPLLVIGWFHPNRKWAEMGPLDHLSQLRFYA